MPAPRPTPAATMSAAAHLIAAAPELYEALDEAINYLAIWAERAQDDHAAALLDKCTAALARARGEPA